MTDKINNKLNDMTLDDYNKLIRDQRNEATYITSTKALIDYGEKVPEAKEALVTAVNEDKVNLNDKYVLLRWDTDYSLNDSGELVLLEANSNDNWRKMINVTAFEDALFTQTQEDTDTKAKPFATINKNLVINTGKSEISLPLGDNQLTVYVGNVTDLVLDGAINDNGSNILSVSGAAVLTGFESPKTDANQSWQDSRKFMLENIKSLNLKKGTCDIWLTETSLVIDFDNHAEFSGVADLI